MCKPTITGEQPEGMQCHNFRLRWATPLPLAGPMGPPHSLATGRACISLHPNLAQFTNRRLGQKKRVLMGLSDIQGWGAFLQQPAAKDEFVVRA